ncbi:MAG: hypothetical protein EAY81_01625 [Bacteroidetes bacterium]|nr:MAG: hypothetical protein EAY81_01625 [Bacteroidota bacterium]
MKSIQKKDFIAAGMVAKAHGTQGEIKLITQIKIKLSKWAFLEIQGKPVPFCIERAGNTLPDEWLVKLQGIDSIEQAQHFVGRTLLIPKPKSRPKVMDEALHLNGFKLFDINFGEIGVVTGTEQLPQQTMLIALYQGKEVMIPLVEAFIDDVDEKKEIIYLNLPEGFLSL